MHNYATLLEARGELQDAKQKYDEAITILKKSTDDSQPTLIDALGNRGALFITLKDFDAARRDLEEVLERNRKVRGPEHPFVGYSLLNLAQLEFSTGNYGEAAKLSDEALQILRPKLPKVHAYIAATLTLKGNALLEGQNAGGAEAPLEEASDAWRIELGERSPEHAISKASLARAWFVQGKRLNEVPPILRASLAIIVAVRGVQDPSAEVVRQWLKDADPKSVC